MNGIKNQQDILAIEAAELPHEYSNTYDLIRNAAETYPNKPALSFFLQTSAYRRAKTWSYDQLLAAIHQTANFFHSLGADKDTVIAYILPNLPETHFVIWGGQATGIVAAINPLLEPSAMEELLNAANASILVTLSPFPGTDLWQKVEKVLDGVPSLKHLVLVNPADHVLGVKRIAARALQRQFEYQLYGLQGIHKAIPDRIRRHSFHAIKKQPEDVLVSNRVIKSSDFSSFFCTGGTTGTPKIAMRRHQNEVANAWSTARFMGRNIGPGKNIFCGLPLFHVNAVQVTGLLPFSKGAHVILGTPQGYRGEGVIPQFWELVEHFKINFFSGVPTLYAALLDVPVKHHDISTLEYGLCGAAPLPLEVMRSFEKRTGLKMLEGYGLTEGTCVSSINPPEGERRAGSIGLRIPGQDMKAIVLDEQGEYLRDCSANEIGVLVISGANVFAGYIEDSQNKGLWIDCDDHRQWMNTGDLGYQDADGYFWLTGRKKELIIRGGHNIDPAVIEEPLHEHVAVQLAAAVGRPDAHAGELPVAYVQLKPGAHTSEAELMSFAREHISERAAIPRQIHIIKEMPVTPVGKIFKPALKKREIQSAVLQVLNDANIDVQHCDVLDDKKKGFLVKVALAQPDDIELAREQLGRFSLAIEIRAETSHLTAAIL